MYLTSSSSGDCSDHEKRLRSRRDRLWEWGIGRLVGQVPLACKEPQERPALLGDVIADRAPQHGIPRLERIQYGGARDRPPLGDVERHLAFDLRQRAQVRRQHHADHASVWTSTDSTAGRSRTMGAQLSPASAERITSQCFCMNSTLGRERCSAMRCTQWPTSAFGSGMYCERRPWLIGFQVVPPSSERNAPAAEMATYSRLAFLGSIRIVWRHIPPAPGCHLGPVPWPRSPASSCHVLPPSLVRNSPASSTPA